MKNKVVQQDNDCWVVVLDRDDQHSFSFWTCSFVLKTYFLSCLFYYYTRGHPLSPYVYWRGNYRYMGCGFRTKRSKVRALTIIGILPGLGGGEGRKFMFCTGSLTRLAIHTDLAGMLNWKLMSTQAAGIKHLFFTWCNGNHQWAAMP